jgi:hypothetical protein
MYDWQTICAALSAFKGKIYKKSVYTQIVLPHQYKKYINLKGIPNKTFVDAVFITPHARLRIRSRIQKGAQGVLFDEKKPPKTLVTQSLFNKQKNMSYTWTLNIFKIDKYFDI